ncbi:MAG: 30S ribosomal protein S4 [Candidatus Marsarchaeota archaeon]|jgi:small subunit ribosomal protein S4|nr:30S ribosomal protein S4 [Candidatus Marsarchaeota archaeon]
MGAPKRRRRKYDRPSFMWSKQRIEEEHKLRDDYGLKNLSELWKAASEIRRIRRRMREVLSGRLDDGVGKDIIAKLAREGIVGENATFDDILVIKPESVLERRLQTVVYRKGMAKTLRQSRQLIAHGFIAINGRRVKSPGYIVRKTEEGIISYYKPIRIEFGPQAPAAARQADPVSDGASQPAGAEAAGSGTAQESK